MALINCPECNKKISDKALTCPNCGYILADENDIEYLEKQVDILNEAIRVREQLKYKNKCDKNTRELLNTIYNMTDKNLVRVKITRFTKSVPIIDNFIKSKLQFLILGNIFFKFNVGHSLLSSISLVISKTYGDINFIKSDLTMSNLKELSGQHIEYFDFDYIEKCKEERYYHLIKSIFEIPKEKYEIGNIIPFSLPCQLNAQSSSNRTGYGNVYNGDYLVYSGTQYGETTRFVIIGVMIEDYYW